MDNRPFLLRVIGVTLIGLAIVLIVILSLVKQQNDKEGAFLCKMVANTPGMSMDQCPAHQDPTSWLLLIGFSIAFIVLASGILLILLTFSMQPLNTDTPRQTVDSSKLDEDSRKVYDLLVQKEGSMYQNDLIKETGFSKVHITRVLDKLEASKILERRRRGMSNIVILR